jgi:glycosyltransferase involved in cell wall biosynthesis
MISVIIPTYKAPEALDLCLTSAIKGQTQKNQIIVVVDGFYDLNKDVLEKHKEHIEVLNLPENVGFCRANNLGVYNATSNKILIAQDDNVFPDEWDVALISNYSPGSVLTPNQIEPTPSMFNQFHIKNLGRDPKTFDLEKFWAYEESIIEENRTEPTGNTFPVFMNKWDYMTIGGLDESYPGAWVVDWEFFMKCEMRGLQMLRTYECHFYHFVSLGTESTFEEKQKKQEREKLCHEYFKYKWGKWAKHNPNTNSKMLDF